jgi:hypothetical protein
LQNLRISGNTLSQADQWVIVSVRYGRNPPLKTAASVMPGSVSTAKLLDAQLNELGADAMLSKKPV